MPTQINSNDVAGATSGLLNLIRMISGKDKVTGGLSVDEKGNATIVPFQGSSGFLGGPSRRQAQAANNKLLSDVYQQQLQNTGQMDVEKLRALYELAKQYSVNETTLKNTELGNAGTLAVTKERGSQDRETEVVKSANAIKEALSKLDGEMLTKLGLTTADLENYQKFVSSRKVKNLGTREKLETGSLNSPDAQKASNMGVLGTMAKPGVDNIVAMKTVLQPNSTAILPDIFGGVSRLVNGPMEKQTSVETGGVVDQKTGQRIGGTSKTLRSWEPASFQSLSPSPEILERARMFGTNAQTQEVPRFNLNAGNISPFAQTAPQADASINKNIGLSYDGNNTTVPKLIKQSPQQIGGIDTMMDAGVSGLVNLIKTYLKYQNMGNDPALRTYNAVIDNPL